MDRPTSLRIGVVGCGFWSRFQIAAWRELSGVEIAGLHDREPARAEALAKHLGLPTSSVFASIEDLIRGARPHAIDVITDPDTHAPLVERIASHKVPVICQKPMAPTLAEAERMVATSRDAGVPFFVHENWRWQAPVRQLKRVLNSGAVGEVFRARIDFVTGFPVFRNQPGLRGLDQFIIADMGSHLLDAARFLFGEAMSLYCQARRVHEDIKGEDVATVVMRMGGAGGGATVTCNMAYAENPIEHDSFPQTFVFVEGTRGSVELGPDYWVRTTTVQGTDAQRHAPPRYPWADPAYAVVQASIVACNANLAAALRGEAPAETTGGDNLKTVRLVAAAYASAGRHQVVDPARI